MSCSSKLMKIGEHIFRVNLCDFVLEIIEVNKTGLPQMDLLLMALISYEEIRNKINEYQKSIADKDVYAKVTVSPKSDCYTVEIDITSFENSKPITTKNLCAIYNKKTGHISHIKSMNIGEFMELVYKLFPNLIKADSQNVREQSGVLYLNEDYFEIESLLNDGYHKFVKFELK